MRKRSPSHYSKPTTSQIYNNKYSWHSHSTATLPFKESTSEFILSPTWMGERLHHPLLPMMSLNLVLFETLLFIIPFPPSVAIAQLNYLNNSLAHPEVTGPQSFHTIVLTANYSLRLEPDDFRGQQVLCMHAFNATLAEIQWPEGAPIFSHVGHAVILFYPGEHECKPGTDTFWNDLLRQKTSCLNPEDLSIFSSMFDRDDDDAMARAIQNNMGIDQDDDMDLDNDDTRLAVHRRNSYHPDTGPASASVQLTPPMTPKVPLEEGEILDAISLSDYPWKTYMCRYETTPTDEPPVDTKPFSILQGSKCLLPPHSALPNTFVLPVQRIITIKLDEARAVFRVPKDYTLRMKVDADELRELVRGLPHATAVWLDYITRTLIRVANDRRTALLLHNPVYLAMVHQLLYPWHIDLYTLPSGNPVRVPKFWAKVFTLITYVLEEGDTEEASEGEIDDALEAYKGGCTLHQASWERDQPQLKKRCVGSYEKGPEEGDLMYPESPVTISGMVHPITFFLANIIPIFSQDMNQSFWVPSPVSSTSISPLSLCPPTPIPPHLIQSSSKPAVVNYMGQTLRPVVNPKVFTSNLQNVGVTFVVIEKARRMRDRDKIIHNKPHSIIEEEDSDWDSCASSAPSPVPKKPVLLLKMSMGPIPHSPLSSVPPSPGPSPPCQRYFDDPWGLVDLPFPLSNYEPDSSAATTPSSNNSMPSLCSCSDSDDSDAYSPLSLEELTHSNVKSKYFAMEPVCLSSETKAALADIPNEPRHFVQRTTEAGKEWDSTALTHITRLHNDDWSPANKFPSNNTKAISPPPFTLDNNQYVYQVVEMFHGPVNNSPLQHVQNKLVNPFHPSYDLLRGVDEYKISTLAPQNLWSDHGSGHTAGPMEGKSA